VHDRRQITSDGGFISPERSFRSLTPWLKPH
jgi:hypothetical protein